MQHEQCVLPVAAISFADLPAKPDPLLLAAEGSHIRVWSLKPLAVLLKKQIFDSQGIHGLHCVSSIQEDQGGKEGHHTLVKCLIWGGREVILAFLKVSKSPDGLQVSCTLAQQPALIDNYILDGCFSSDVSVQSESGPLPIRVVVVSAYNTLFSINFASFIDGEKNAPCPQRLSQGVFCALYSAHIKVIDTQTLLVASGTVFGAIHLWQFAIDKDTVTKVNPTTGRLICSFPGHEGSVFGVRIFQLPNASPSDLFVSSCSDDRSIKLWAVPDIGVSRLFAPSDEVEKSSDNTTGLTKFSLCPKGVNQPLLTSVIGHISRIWNTRVCKIAENGYSLISFGEDATAQIWRMLAYLPDAESNEKRLDLKAHRKISHHVGKNIWAGEIHEGPQTLLVTGGADGRVVLSKLHAQSENAFWSSADDRSLSGQSSLVGYPRASVASPRLEKRPRARGSRSTQEDMFKSYCWLDESVLLATTAGGGVKLGSLKLGVSIPSQRFTASSPANHEGSSMQWDTIGQLNDLASFALTSGVPRQLALLSGNGGNVYIYLPSQKVLKTFLSLPQKVTFLHVNAVDESNFTANSVSCQKFGAVFTCLEIQCAYFIIFDNQNIASSAQRRQLLRSASLPKGFIVRSGTILSSSLLVLGSRGGDLALYDITDANSQTSLYPILTQYRVHQGESISSISEISNDQRNFIITTGRDGCLVVHEIIHNERRPLVLRRVHRVLLPFGPNIEGVYIHKNANELILWGFRGQELIVWNYKKQQEIMAIDCKGTRRSWSFIPHASDAGGGSLAWTRASECHVYFQSEASHKLVQHGAHGREIKAIAIRPAVEDQLNHIVATGAEDTTICIYEYKESSALLDRPFDCLGILHNHTTGVQKLRWSPNGRYLFSAAGKEEFYVWQIESVPFIRLGLVNLACCPRVSESGDLRIADFDILCNMQGSYTIAMGYSDSSIRLWRFQSESAGHSLRLLQSGIYSTVCITQCRFILSASVPYVLTCATDGYLALWAINDLDHPEQDIAKTEGNVLQSPESDICQLSFKDSETVAQASGLSLWASTRVHQSSIKSMTYTSLSHSSVLVATGGDDNAIGLTIATICKDLMAAKAVPHFITLLIPKAHASAINALGISKVCEEARADTIESKSPNGEEKTLVDLMGFTLLSASNDQRIKAWSVGIETPSSSLRALSGLQGPAQFQGHPIHVSKLDSKWSSVADVGYMDVLNPSVSCDRRRVMVAGVGIETWTID